MSSCASPPRSTPRHSPVTTALTDARSMSRVLQLVARHALQLVVAQRGALAGARLVSLHESRQTIGVEVRPRDAEHRDGALDPLGRPLHLHEIIHPRIALEADRGTLQLVLCNVAIDGARHDVAEV